MSKIVNKLSDTPFRSKSLPTGTPERLAEQLYRSMSGAHRARNQNAVEEIADLEKLYGHLASDMPVKRH